MVVIAERNNKQSRRNRSAMLLIHCNKNNKLDWLQGKHKQIVRIIFIILATHKDFIRSTDSSGVGLRSNIILITSDNTMSTTMKFSSINDIKNDLETKSSNKATNSNSSDNTYKCLNYGYTKGKWEHYINESGKDDYYWKTTSLDCHLEPWSPESFCKVLDKRSLLLVGDSVTGQLFYGLKFFYGVNSTNTILQSLPDWNYPPVHETASICNDDVVVTWVRNDWLTVNEPLKWNITKDCLWGPWWHFLRYHDILILNTGAHTRPIADYQKNLVKVKNYLIQNNYKGKVIFRTTPRGHINCTKHDKHPIQFNDYDYNRFFISMPNEANYTYQRYSYDSFLKYNNIMKEIVQDTPFEVIDLAPIMELRPDIHKKPPIDCLHFSTDWFSALSIWMKLLQNAISGNLKQ